MYFGCALDVLKMGLRCGFDMLKICLKLAFDVIKMCIRKITEKKYKSIQMHISLKTIKKFLCDTVLCLVFGFYFYILLGMVRKIDRSLKSVQRHHFPCIPDYG